MNQNSIFQFYILHSQLIINDYLRITSELFFPIFNINPLSLSPFTLKSVVLNFLFLNSILKLILNSLLAQPRN